MFIDLNVPVPNVSGKPTVQSKKGKGKQQQQQAASIVFTPAQLSAIEARIDLLLHLGYTAIALNQTVQKKVDPKTFVNVLDPLLSQLRKRTRVAFLKRLTIVLDEESEKGFGLTTGNASLFTSYDILALTPTTATTFSLACLTHTAPSPLTTHIISLPLTLPRLPFNLRHTLVRTALKNGAVFEITYAGALGGESDLGGVGGEGGTAAKRNWWAAAREVVRVTKGKGIIVSSGAVNQSDLRAPRDVGNLITILGLAQNLAHDASTRTAQSLILRAQTRKTYRAVFSEPKVVIPESYKMSSAALTDAQATSATTSTAGPSADTQEPVQAMPTPATIPPPSQPVDTTQQPPVQSKPNGKKRALDEVHESTGPSSNSGGKEESARKRKKSKGKDAKLS